MMRVPGSGRNAVWRAIQWGVGQAEVIKKK